MSGAPNERVGQALHWLQMRLNQQRQSGGGGGGSFNGPRGPTKGLVGGAGALLLLGVAAAGFNSALFNVDGGHRAIKYTRIGGVKPDIYPEGTHFMIPWFETPITYDVRAKPRNVASLTGTKDLQMVNITCRVLSRPDVRALPSIYRTLGTDFDELQRVLPSIVNEVLKSVVAQFNASQLITQRALVSRLVKEQLVVRAAKFNILLDDVSLTHVQFSPEFTAAVEAKQIAQQEAQRAAFVVDRAIQEKQGTIIKATGEAKSIELIGKNFTRGFYDLRRIEAAREISKIISQGGNRLLLDSENLLLNVGEEKPSAGKKR